MPGHITSPPISKSDDVEFRSRYALSYNKNEEDEKAEENENNIGKTGTNRRDNIIERAFPQGAEWKGAVKACFTRTGKQQEKNEKENRKKRRGAEFGEVVGVRP
jgi:hypothetical protein